MHLQAERFVFLFLGDDREFVKEQVKACVMAPMSPFYSPIVSLYSQHSICWYEWDAIINNIGVSHVISTFHEISACVVDKMWKNWIDQARYSIWRSFFGTLGPESAIGRPTAAARKFDTGGSSNEMFSMPPPPVARAGGGVLMHQDSAAFEEFSSRFESVAGAAPVAADPFGGKLWALFKKIGTKTCWRLRHAWVYKWWDERSDPKKEYIEWYSLYLYIAAFGDPLMPLDTSGSLGFDNDASNDPFLSLTEPPPVPKTTPMHMPSDNAWVPWIFSQYFKGEQNWWSVGICRQ
jgi:hypothetical protein